MSDISLAIRCSECGGDLDATLDGYEIYVDICRTCKEEYTADKIADLEQDLLEAQNKITELEAKILELNPNIKQEE